MIAADGRVRVLDFGLSRAALPDEPPPSASSSSSGALQLQVTAAGSLVGTPAYMSPEQLAREEADPRSDQFSFCVAVWEALYRERPFTGRSVHELAKRVRKGEIAAPPAGTRVPAWLRRVLERGLAVEPAARWPDVEALLAALAKDPVRTRRRRLAAVAGVLGIASAGYGGAIYGAAQAEVCDAGGELFGVWDGERRAAVDRAVRATGVAYAERAAETIVGHLDAYAARWAALHAATCAAHQRGRLSDAQHGRRTACLRQRRDELEATAGVLVQTTKESAAQAVDTARGLPAVALCEDDEHLTTTAEDPAIAAAVEAGRTRLARLQALERAGRFGEALTDIAPLVASADALGHLPFRAEVHMLAGKLYMHELKPEARGHYEDAVKSGLAAGAEVLVAEALALQMFQIGAVERRPLEALVIEPIAWGFMRRIGDPPRLTALLHNSVGVTYYEVGQRERSFAEYEAALALLEKHEPDNPLRWAALQNFASALGDVGQHERAGALVRASIGQLEQQFGRCHPFTASMQMVLGKSDGALGRSDAAVRGLDAAIDCLGEAYPGYAWFGLADLGQMYLQLGETAKAREQVARAERLRAQAPAGIPFTLEVDILAADLDIADGKLAEVRRSLELLRGRALEMYGAQSEILAGVDVRLGLVVHREHADEEALVHLQRAERSLGQGYRSQERGLYAFTLARVLRALGREPQRVTTLLDEAIAAYTTAGAQYAGRVAEIRAWQAEAG